MTTKENVKTDPLAAVFAADDKHEVERLGYEAISENIEGCPPEYLQPEGSAICHFQAATDSPDFPLAALPLVPLAIAAGHKIYSAWLNGGKAGKFVPEESTWFSAVNAFRKALPRFSAAELNKPATMESIELLVKQGVSPQQIHEMTGVEIGLIRAYVEKPGETKLPEVADYPALKKVAATDTNQSLAHLEQLGELRLVAKLLRSVGCVS